MKKQNIPAIGFQLPIHIACGSDDVRPIMQYVLFKDGFALATDAYILVKQSLKEVHALPEDQIKLLEGNFIHKWAFAEIMKFEIMTVEKDGIRVGKFNTEIKYFFLKIGDKYPDFDQILKGLDAEKEPLTYIGLNPNNLSRVCKACGFNPQQTKLSFWRKNKAIRVSEDKAPKNRIWAIVMPIMVEDDE